MSRQRTVTQIDAKARHLRAGFVARGLLLRRGGAQQGTRRGPEETRQGKEGPMIPKDCKRVAEVDFPIAKVSRHAGWDLPAAPAAQAGKSIRHGHPSTLHLLRTDPQTENNRRKE